MWDENAHLVPRIRAALEIKQPPIAVILDDPTHTEWTPLDYKLVKAYYIRENMMVGNVPIYWDQSDRVTFSIKTGTSKSRAAIERWEKKMSEKKTKEYGKFGYPVPQTIDGGPLPTLDEWAEEQARKTGTDGPKSKWG